MDKAIYVVERSDDGGRTFSLVSELGYFDESRQSEASEIVSTGKAAALTAYTTSSEPDRGQLADWLTDKGIPWWRMSPLNPASTEIMRESES